jgi:hypothetical protein
MSTGSISELAKELRRGSARRRTQLLAACSNALRSATIRNAQLTRVAIVRLLAALMPESAPTIQRWIRRRDADAAEVQFSLFCYLDQARDLVEGRQGALTILSLVGEYLHAVDSDRARAAWMAGDLLGDHWPLEESLEVLIRGARTGRFAAGREGAVHGLSHALERASKKDQWRIVEVLREVASQDRSRRIRRYAGQVVGDLRGL